MMKMITSPMMTYLVLPFILSPCLDKNCLLYSVSGSREFCLDTAYTLAVPFLEIDVDGSKFYFTTI